MQVEEALRFKTLAEDKYKLSNLKSALKYAKRAQHLFPDLGGISEMVTAFKILRAAGKSDGPGGSPEWYKILQVEPFSNINTIKQQYKKLALILHPDKNSFVASGEAFKLVGDAFRCLSDKIPRKEYDMKLRIAIQEAATTTEGGGGEIVETFWTACSKCRLMHQFERRYIGHNLMCPRCNTSFLAVEIGQDENESGGEAPNYEGGRSRIVDSKRKMSRVDEVLERSKSTRVESSEIFTQSTSGKTSERLRLKRMKAGEEMTLAEMQSEAKRKVLQGKMKVKSMEGKEKKKDNQRPHALKKSGNLEVALNKPGNLDTEVASGELTKCKGLETERSEASASGELKKSKALETKRSGASKNRGNVSIQKRASKGGLLEIERRGLWKSGDFEIMAVEDSDFYDFDKDRGERSFKKGQVWAIYDDDDGMPRHYGLIDEVISVNPFEVKMSWLDLQNSGNEVLICWEKLGFHISCGRFKVAKKTVVNSVNFFSHVVDSERAAKEIYRIYPKKGSVWALYNEGSLDAEGMNSKSRCYDIAVFLTNYSEMHGLSMAYLEKVDGFKTVFKRQEVGCHAIKWFEKDEVRLFSHQIPARKLSGKEAPELLKDCWELDPASLPPELLTIGWEG